mgnify:CR=1 FL=1
MVKTTDLVAAMRCSSQAPVPFPPCATCAYRVVELLGGKEYAGCDCDRMGLDAADRLEELVDRCARYAEEIAVLREMLSRVPVAERLPKKDGKYLCWYGFGPNRNVLFCQVLDYYAIDPMPHFQHEGLNGMTVTHWMEIPGVEV